MKHHGNPVPVNMKYHCQLLFCALLCTVILPVVIQAQNYDESKVPAYTLPDPLLSLDNKTISNKADWENLRRKEILYLFSNHVYGKVPKTYDSINFSLESADYTAMSNKAHLKQVRIDTWRKGMKNSIHLVLFIPAKASGPVPLLLLINNRGSEITDPLRKTTSGFWPAEMLIEKGFAIAAFQVNDAAPDNAEHYQEGLLRLFPEQAKAKDGIKAIGAWSYAASRVMDYLETEQQVDPKRIGLVGHSRAGKAALWAAAQDQRFAFVFSNCSGNSGAAISRRMFGETVERINTRFPWWFNDNYKKFNDSIDKLPVDQHMLIALIAPRPVYVTSATNDLWADPRGSFLALKNAEKVYGLYQLSSNLPADLPPADQPVINSSLGYHLRTGDHDLTPYDWTQFIQFVQHHR